MSTRSMIGRRNSDGTIRAIYCHWDGYPDYNGVILKRYYRDDRKITDLLTLGNLSSLGPQIGEKHKFDDGDLAQNMGWCTAYGRDRGEIGVESRRYIDVDEIIAANNWCEYFYIWESDDYGWVCYNSDGDMEHIPEKSHIIA